MDSLAQRSRNASSPLRTRSSTPGSVRTCTSVHANAAYRFDGAPTWSMITSRAAPMTASSGDRSSRKRRALRGSRHGRSRPLPTSPDLGDDGLDAPHGPAFAGAASRPGSERAGRADERLATVDPVEELDETLEVRGGRRLRCRPTTRSRAGEVALDPLRAEEVMGTVSPPGEELRRELEADEPVGGQADPGLVLEHLLEASDPRGRKDANEPEPGDVGDEGVPEPSASLREEARGVAEGRRIGACEGPRRTPSGASARRAQPERDARA
jgi:hypothetical protein